MTDHPQPAATGARAARRPMRLRLAAFGTALLAVAATVGVGVAAGPWNDSVVDPGTVNGCQILSSSLNPLSVSSTGASAVVSLAWSIPPNDCRNQTEVLRAEGVCPGGDSASPPAEDSDDAAIFLGASTQVALVPGTSATNTPGVAGTFCYGLVGVHVKAAPNWTGPLSNLRQIVVPPDPSPPDAELFFRKTTTATALCDSPAQLSFVPDGPQSSFVLKPGEKAVWIASAATLARMEAGVYAITLQRQDPGSGSAGTVSTIRVSIGVCLTQTAVSLVLNGSPGVLTFGNATAVSPGVQTLTATITVVGALDFPSGFFAVQIENISPPPPGNKALADFAISTANGPSFIVGPVH